MQESSRCPICGAAANVGSGLCGVCGGKLDAAIQHGESPPPSALKELPTPAARSQYPDWTDASASGRPLQAQQPAQTGAGTSATAWPASGAPDQVNPGQEPAAASHGTCLQHTGVPAVARCASCGVGLCGTCDFLVPVAQASLSILQLGPGMHMCASCAAARARSEQGLAPTSPAPPVIPLGAGIKCSRHAEVPAVRYCYLCRTAMCQTCDFELPGRFHVCPGCATDPKREMGSGRKTRIILAYVLAVWTTLGLALMFAGVLAGMVRTKSDEEALGYAFAFFVYLPALAGIGLSVSSIDRKLGTPPVVWGAVVWNLITLSVLVILTIVGSLR